MDSRTRERLGEERFRNLATVVLICVGKARLGPVETSINVVPVQCRTGEPWQPSKEPIGMSSRSFGEGLLALFPYRGCFAPSRLSLHSIGGSWNHDGHSPRLSPALASARD